MQVLGDADRDGYLDAAFGGDDTTTTEYITLVNGMNSGVRVGATWTGTLDYPNAYFQGDFGGALGDIDGDGFVELLVLLPMDVNSALHLSMGGFAGAAPFSGAPLCDPGAIKVRDLGDWNGDGFDDLAFGCANAAYLQLGPASSTPIQITPPAATSSTFTWFIP
jgi:hypothetical protein